MLKVLVNFFGEQWRKEAHRKIFWACAVMSWWWLSLSLGQRFLSLGLSNGLQPLCYSVLPGLRLTEEIALQLWELGENGSVYYLHPLSHHQFLPVSYITFYHTISTKLECRTSNMCLQWDICCQSIAPFQTFTSATASHTWKNEHGFKSMDAKPVRISLRCFTDLHLVLKNEIQEASHIKKNLVIRSQ